jgi:signal transduction histidine kinase/GAF domain-containing protein
MERGDSDRELSTAERFAALSRVGAALMSELDESRLLHLIAETACTLTGAQFAAFSLRPVDESGQPLVPSEGNLFHLAAVVGVTKEQEALFRRTPLGGEGLLAPIFRHGVSVRVPDVLSHLAHTHEAHSQMINERNIARDLASAYSDGQLSTDDLRSMGIPRGHPLLRSFLGAPLLDRDKQVRGGLLLGHIQIDQFTAEDEALLIGLASQAAVALENARLYHSIQMRSQELNAIFENIADGITLINGQEQILRENETARRLRNYVQGSPEGSQMIESLLHAPARSALQDELVQHTTVILHDQYAEIREYLVTASPLYIPTRSGPLSQEMDKKNTNERTTSGAAVVVWHDVTERRIREAEQAAKEQAKQLEAIFESMMDGIFVYDHDGRIIQTNSVARTLLARIFPANHAAHTSLERFTEHFIVDDQGQRLPFEQWPASRALAGEALTPDHAIDISLKTLDGLMIHTSITGGPLRNSDGHILGAVLICRDVTERRRLEEIERQMHAETEANRALLQLILDELPISVYLVRGSDARLVLANRAATAIWGATWPQGQPFAAFLQEYGIRIMGADGQLLQPEQFATLRAVQYGENVYQHQESIRHADGTTLPVQVDAVAIDAHHLAQTVTKPLQAGISDCAALVVHQDVTALKEAERLKDEFIGLAAHELRTPVAILKGFAQTLIKQTARGKGPTLVDWQIEALQGIDQATIRLVELTEDLLDVTRLQAGRLVLQLEPTNLIPLVQRLVRRVQMTTERHQISIDTILPYLVASVDSRRIEQVLNNILGNAIKYCPAGGSIEVHILQDEQAQMALLSVKDHGIGIPLHQQARIFDRFTRAENAQAYGIGGTGLGLYLCRELVERHGGHIWFESREGAGSTFFVALPLLPDASEDIEEL